MCEVGLVEGEMCCAQQRLQVVGQEAAPFGFDMIKLGGCTGGPATWQPQSMQAGAGRANPLLALPIGLAGHEFAMLVRGAAHARASPDVHGLRRGLGHNNDLQDRAPAACRAGMVGASRDTSGAERRGWVGGRKGGVDVHAKKGGAQPINLSEKYENNAPYTQCRQACHCGCHPLHKCCPGQPRPVRHHNKIKSAAR